LERYHSSSRDRWQETKVIKHLGWCWLFRDRFEVSCGGGTRAPFGGFLDDSFLSDSTVEMLKNEIEELESDPKDYEL